MQTILKKGLLFCSRVEITKNGSFR